jgi:hypothetical protein
MSKAGRKRADAGETPQQFYACGVYLAVPSDWRDRTIHAFVGPPEGRDPRVARSRRAAAVNPSVSISTLGRSTLTEAIRAMPPPSEAMDMTILGESQHVEPWGRLFERVIRFSEPVENRVVQQSLRLVEVSGEVFALTFSSPASDFNRQYDVFAKLAASFVTQKSEGPK